MSQKNRGRERLDVLLVAKGMAESREQAKRLILAGSVIVPGSDLPKPGQLVDVTTEISLKATERYVSRGGLKLEEALEKFAIDLTGKLCADIGASTGGFTDCMLQHGATRVFAVDVGASQMHERLKKDPRVELVENMNARELTGDSLREQPEFVAVDVSFISILRVTEALVAVVKPKSDAVFLIKPQFEAGREAVSRGRGVIRDPQVHSEVLQRVITGLEEQGWNPLGLIPSPIRGGSGNVEFLCYARQGTDKNGLGAVERIDIDEAIRCAGAKP